MLESKPALHFEFKIGDRVKWDLYGNGNHTGVGTITGIATIHIIFNYTITLDQPLDIPGYEGWTTFTIPGTLLQLLERKQ